MLAGPINLLTVLAGFTLIIVIHELGHFLAARLFGIRVLAFAVGFGPAICSFRRGLGFRRGSSEPEFLRRSAARNSAGEAASVGSGGGRGDGWGGGAAISPTEYRLNWLPFGGYVKMLGQDDVDPSATSSEPDSYAAKKPWQRMVVISAGVVFNLMLAAILFIAVFMVGLQTEPPIIGEVLPGSPAELATASNADRAGVLQPGLRPGDIVRSVNGDPPRSFNDLVVAVAMGKKQTPVVLEIERAGVDQPLRFDVLPEVGPESLQAIGVGPAVTTTLRSIPPGGRSADRATALDQLARQLAAIGLPGVRAGAELVKIDGRAVTDPYPLDAITLPAGSSPDDPEPAIELTFTQPAEPPANAASPERTITVRAPLRPTLMTHAVMVNSGEAIIQPHLAGLVPLMRVADAGDSQSGGFKAGLRTGDLFVQIGRLEWPGLAEGTAQILAHAKAGAVRVVVLRSGDDGIAREVDLGEVPVVDGRIGFTPAPALQTTRLAAWPRLAEAVQSKALPASAAGSRPAAPLTPSLAETAALPPGALITKVNGTPVSTFGQLRSAIIAALDDTDPSQSITLTYLPPALAPDTRPGQRAVPAEESVAWTPRADEADALRALGWQSPLTADDFERKQTLLKAASPLEAVSMGLHETRRVMLTTYLTFARLAQGSVKVEHLRGPVGIAHAGTLIAERGLIWLLFFMALISVNLAVVNFLPVPIADGGHMVFLLYEQFSGRPPSIRVQNIAAIAGLILLGSVFLLVTFHDVARLLG